MGNGVTDILFGILSDCSWFLYSFSDIVNMDPQQFVVTYHIQYSDAGVEPKTAT